jgi:predicted metal-dependent phosphoesterase TrpH
VLLAFKFNFLSLSFKWVQNMCVDLHSHSVYSDGTATPTELVRMAVAAELTGFALTDHDTVEGVQEVLRLGVLQGLNVLSGIELSAQHGEYLVHILGYGFNPEDPSLLAWLDQVQRERKERNHRILDKLASLGMPLSWEETERVSGCGQMGRPHIARLLLEKGHVSTIQQAFYLYLGAHKAAWCGRFAYPAHEAIAILHEAGGVAVLAHPGCLASSAQIQVQVIQELIRKDLDGLEVYYPGHTPTMIKRFKALAQQHGLLVTGGSDYHGKYHGDKYLKGLANPRSGLCPPDSILEGIQAGLKRALVPCTPTQL